MADPTIIAIANRYIGQIPVEMGVIKAYLFGSHARGKAGEDSDIDIALVIENMGDFFEAQMQLMRLRRKVDLRIEPHPIEAGDFTGVNPFAEEIKKHGIELRIKPQAGIRQ